MCQRQTVLAQRVNFLKVCGAIVFVTRWSMLCAKAKNKHISKGCSGALLKTYQPSSMQSWWAGAVWNGLPASLRFDMKTRRPQVFLPFNLVTRCTFIPSRASYFKLCIKLVLCCRITRWCNKCRNEAPKMSNNWPKVRKKPKRSRQKSVNKITRR